MSDLTGKRRYRLEKRLFREPLLVLQVQVRDRAFDPWGGYPILMWRDATAEDLLTIEASHSPFPLARDTSRFHKLSTVDDEVEHA